MAKVASLKAHASKKRAAKERQTEERLAAMRADLRLTKEQRAEAAKWSAFETGLLGEAYLAKFREYFFEAVEWYLTEMLLREEELNYELAVALTLQDGRHIGLHRQDGHVNLKLAIALDERRSQLGDARRHLITLGLLKNV